MAFRQAYHASKRIPPDLDKFLDELFYQIARELLEKAEQVKQLGELYEREAAEYAARTAERDARTAERDARTAERDARTTERDARTAERDARTTERDVRTAERDARTAERDARTIERDTRTAERDARTVERDTRTAERDAETAQREAKTAEKEILAAQHLAKAEKYRAMSLQHDKKIEENQDKLKQLEVVSTALKTLSELSEEGTGLLKKLTPLQIEFKTQVNKRAKLTNEVAAKIEACNSYLHEGERDKLAKELASLEDRFEELDKQVAAEDKAQDDLVDVLDRYEAVVGEMQSALGTIQDQESYYTQFKTKICDVEQGFLNQQNAALEANRPAKVGSDELGEQCRQAFLLLKQRLQPKKPESPASSVTSTPPRESSLPSRASSDDESDSDLRRSSPDGSPKSTTAQLTERIGPASSSAELNFAEPASAASTFLTAGRTASPLVAVSSFRPKAATVTEASAVDVVPKQVAQATGGAR